MEIKKITQGELPINLIFRLNHLYKVKLGDFVVITDSDADILYVNHNVPQKDIEGFLKVLTFPHYGVADEETETGEFLDYVYGQYGFGTYSILIDSHSRYMERQKKARAKEVAEAIIPLIEKEINSKDSIVEYDEYLAFEIWKHGHHLGKHTPNNISSYGSVYEFYFGYLMGAGILSDGGAA